MSTVRPLAEIEKAAILRAVRLARGRTTLAAKALGIGRMTLHRRLRSYGFNARAVYDAWVGLPRLRREEAKAKLRARRQSILDRQERALDALAASGGVGDQASRGRLAERMALA
ncbi:MAG: helix-turn-helix domain-containing protein, partial [Planctomycetota bacterium]